MNTAKRMTVAICSIVAFVLLVASSPLGGQARSAAFVGIQPDSPALKHYSVAGVGLATSVYAGVADEGCMVNSSIQPQPAALFGAVALPEGSIIKYVTMFYRDETPLGAVRGWLRASHYWAGPPYGDDIVYLVSSDGGFNSVTSDELNQLVTNVGNFWQLKSEIDGYQGLWLCGFRIDYIPPSIFGVALPTILKNNP